MDNEQCIKMLATVVSVLNSVMLRADQMEALQRIDLCTRELKNMMAEMRNPQNKEE